MTVKEVLTKARELIADPKNWTTGQLCDVHGRKCALGAIAAALWGEDVVRDDEPYDRLENHPAVKAIEREIDEKGYDRCDTVLEFNDQHGDPDHHSKVLALFDRAIKARR